MSRNMAEKKSTNRTFTEADRIACQNLNRIWGERREKLGLTRYDLADMLGIGYSAVGHMFSGQMAIPSMTVLILAEILGVKATDIRPDFKYLLSAEKLRLDPKLIKTVKKLDAYSDDMINEINDIVEFKEQQRQKIAREKLREKVINNKDELVAAAKEYAMDLGRKELHKKKFDKEINKIWKEIEVNPTSKETLCEKLNGLFGLSSLSN